MIANAMFYKDAGEGALSASKGASIKIANIVITTDQVECLIMVLKFRNEISKGAE